jgi:ABC-type glycerol-3-phosphate transport system permease component
MTKSRRRRLTAIMRYAVLTVWAVIAFFPIFWMVSTSVKPDTQWFSWPPVYFPHPPTADNYRNVWLGAEQYAATQYAISSQKPLISLRNSVVCVAGRGAICRHAICDLVAKAADLAAQLGGDRHHLDAAGRAVRIGDRVRRVAL